MSVGTGEREEKKTSHINNLGAVMTQKKHQERDKTRIVIIIIIRGQKEY